MVLDDLHLAVGNVFARDVVAGGGLWVKVQTFGRARRLDRAQASATSRSTGPAGSRCSRLGGCGCRGLGGAAVGASGFAAWAYTRAVGVTRHAERATICGIAASLCMSGCLGMLGMVL